MKDCSGHTGAPARLGPRQHLSIQRRRPRLLSPQATGDEHRECRPPIGCLCGEAQPIATHLPPLPLSHPPRGAEGPAARGGGSRDPVFTSSQLLGPASACRLTPTLPAATRGPCAGRPAAAQRRLPLPLPSAPLALSRSAHRRSLPPVFTPGRGIAAAAPRRVRGPLQSG